MEKDDYELKVEQMKSKDRIYLKELQAFFDKVDSVENEELKKEILRQMHRCEQRVIKMCKEVTNKSINNAISRNNS